MGQFNEKTILITGANTGIGKSIALAFGSEGANVIVNYIFGEELAIETVDEIKKLGGNAVSVYGDVTKFADAENIIKSGIGAFSKIDVLVNNSGITKDNLIMRMSEEDFDQVIDVNLKGTWNMCKNVTRHMMKNRSGKIINISSVVGIMGNAGQSNYVASKAGVIGLTKSLSKEFGSRNITVNAVAPGFIETKMTESLSKEVIDNYLNQIPLRKLGKPSDIADAVLFLASDKADYITGQVISVNGGMI